ncbi:MAG: Ig-like domain-containing protein [Bacteroidota bacterium]
MKFSKLLYHMLVLVCFWGTISCATPKAPTGGPADKSAPELLLTKPESGTVNFKGRSFTFAFDKWMNRGSISNAITVEPELGLSYDVKWKRKTATIQFRDEFPDSTTIIVTLGTDLADSRGNKLASPVRIAVSTGDEIDSGEIYGLIRSAETGKGATGDVLLYREPVDITQRAAYSIQTDTSGFFQFSYLREGNYQAFYVDDRNRNKIWEPELEQAQPFFRSQIKLEKGAQDTLDVIYIAETDTIAPDLQGLGLLSSQRMRLRFDESIFLSETTSLTVTDSVGAFLSSVTPLYVSETDDFILFAHSDTMLSADASYQLRITGIEDAAGNSDSLRSAVFAGSSQQDTTLQALLGASNGAGIYPDEPVEVVYRTLINDQEIIDSLVVVEGEVSFNEWPALRVNGNRLEVLPQEDTWIEGVNYQFLFWNPNTRRRQLVEPELWEEVDYGEIEIRWDSASVVTDTPLTVRIESKETGITIDTTLTTQTLINNLPPVDYRLTAFEDENKNGIWDPGSIFPYQKPERYFIRPKVSVRKGFTSEVILSF